MPLTKEEIKKTFSLEDRTAVLRPSVTEQPANGNFAGVEKILVDILIENKKLTLFEGSELIQVFRKISQQNRINIPQILRYGRRRKVERKILDILNIPMAL